MCPFVNLCTQVLARSTALRRGVLTEVSFKLNTWMESTKKMKAVYHVMNLLKTDAKQV